MKYAHLDTNKKILGWYSDDVHGTFVSASFDEDGKLLKDSYYDISKIPTPNIKVTEEQWQVAIDNGHNKVNTNGTTELFDFRTTEEITLAKNEQKITEAKQYLADTDWIVVKINEAALINENTAQLLTKYADILSERENKRLTINQLESSI